MTEKEVKALHPHHTYDSNLKQSALLKERRPHTTPRQMRCKPMCGGEPDKPKPKYNRFFGIITLVAFLVLFPSPTECRDDPIEVLCLVPFHGITLNQQRLRKEPMFEVTYIPSERYSGLGWGDHPEYNDREVRRFIRRYFPRNYGDLAENYEFILLLTMNVRTDWDYFTSRQIEMMRRGIEEGGLGALRGASRGGSGWEHERWAGLSLSDAFPNDAHALLAEDEPTREGSGRFVINDDPSLPPVLKPYRNLTMRGYYPYNTRVSGPLMIPRQGSQIYSWMVCDAFSEYTYPKPGWIPHVLGWKYGKGYTWSIADHATGGFFTSREMPEGHSGTSTYLYGHDAFFGLVMYGAGRDPPLDVVMVHNLRERFGEFAEAMAFVYSMVDFIEKFEVNTNPLLLKAASLQERWEEGRRLYMAQEWEESREVMESLVEDTDLFVEEALEFKDKALLWVYVTEWLVVSGTFLTASYILWTLMVRRRLYREVEGTRLTKRVE